MSSCRCLVTWWFFATQLVSDDPQCATSLQKLQQEALMKLELPRIMQDQDPLTTPAMLGDMVPGLLLRGPPDLQPSLHPVQQKLWREEKSAIPQVRCLVG